jgi:serine/threonine protein kinase
VEDPSLNLEWAWQTAEGPSFLHSRAVLHCDLQPDKHLLDGDLHVKIYDCQSAMGDFYEAAI